MKKQKKISMERLYLQSCIDVGITPDTATYEELKKEKKYYSIKDIWDCIERYEEDIK